MTIKIIIEIDPQLVKDSSWFDGVGYAYAGTFLRVSISTCTQSIIIDWLEFHCVKC